MAASPKVGINFSTFSLLSKQTSPQVFGIPFIFCTMDAMFLLGSIWESSSKHHAEETKLGERMTRQIFESLIAFTSSKEMGFPFSTCLSSLKVEIPWATKALYRWPKNFERVSFPLKLIKTSHSLFCWEEEEEEDGVEGILLTANWEEEGKGNPGFNLCHTSLTISLIRSDSHLYRRRETVRINNSISL